MIADEDRTGSHEGPPAGWDRLDVGEEPEVEAAAHDGPAQRDESAIPLIAGSWGDLALILAVVAAALVTLKLSGYGAPFAAAGWALALAVLWWGVAAATLVAIRRATPGMLLAGLQFDHAVPPRRVAWVVVVALLLCATLGIPAAVGPRGWALRAAAGSRVSPAHEPS
jgi:hypothetical protein